MLCSRSYVAHIVMEVRKIYLMKDRNPEFVLEEIFRLRDLRAGRYLRD